MSEYTPDEFAVRGAYNYARGASVGSDAGLDSEFDRFLAKIKANAWDHGYAVGLLVDYGSTRTNPYRRGET